jgi:hypothetical protein
MRVPKPFTSFDVDASTVSLWLFKKTPQPAASPPKYTAHWVDTNDELDVALKEAPGVGSNPRLPAGEGPLLTRSYLQPTSASRKYERATPHRPTD